MVFRGISRYFAVFCGISRYFAVFRGISRYFVVFSGIQRYSAVFVKNRVFSVCRPTRGILGILSIETTPEGEMLPLLRCQSGRRAQFTVCAKAVERRRGILTGVSAALEIGAAAPTPAASSTTALQIGPPRRAAAQSCAIMWRASPAAASSSFPDYGAYPRHRQTTTATVGPAPSAPW